MSGPFDGPIGGNTDTLILQSERLRDSLYLILVINPDRYSENNDAMPRNDETLVRITGSDEKDFERDGRSG